MWGLFGVVIEDSVKSALIPIPSIAINENTEITTVWQSKNDDSIENVYINKINENGFLVFPTNTQVSRFVSRKAAPQVVWSDKFSDIVFWYDYRDSTDVNIYAQKLNSLAQRLWDENDISISTRIDNQRSFQATSDLQGGAIIYWYEIGTGSGWGIFAQQVSRNGNLGEVLTTSVSEPKRGTVPKGYFLYQSYPNPFNSSMLIKYELPKSTFVQLRILDLNGKEVRSLVDGRYPPGQHSVVWDGKDQHGQGVASGVYFCQLLANGQAQWKKMLLLR